ncbi:MAG: TRAP transporter large permease [Firmicutes bacterium]|nr:TRAP transporter large permease [Bacillota bacterium]
MSPVEIGIIGIILLFVLFFLGVPIAFAMAIVGVLGFGYINSWQAGFGILARDFFGQFSSYSLSAITMFVLMGSFAFVAGIGQRLYKAAYGLVGDRTGGLGIATIIGCASFAAICGSTAATAATMGKIALPEMKKYRYNDTLATGTVASGGTLGILIPPSTVFIVYGFLTDQSIGELFVAGILHGLVLTLFFALTVYLMCRINPELGPPGESISLKEKVKAFFSAFEALGVFALVIGGLFLGWFSPVQAGGIGAALALLIGLLRRQVTWKNFVEYTKDGLRTSAMILAVIAGATIFGRFMAITTIPFSLVNWVQSLHMPPTAIVAVIIFIFFIGGFFIDVMALITILIPILFPVVKHLGLDLIWFGVIIVLVSNLGVLTPPVGVNVYVIKAIAPEVPLGQIFKGTVPFMVAIVVATAITMAFPSLSLFLPGLLK